jgi:ActR/RegA family two-component response regulator
MKETDNLIFIIYDDLGYGRYVQARLIQNNYTNVHLYDDEKSCLSDMKRLPAILIVDYHLKDMSGLQLIQRAKNIHPDFYSILLSGEYHNTQSGNSIDERFLKYIDKYIIKGMNDMEELFDALDDFSE